MSAPIKVLIVDDHAMVRSGLRVMIESAPGLAVVGEAAGVGDAVAAASALDPDVVLMDLRLPDGSGVEACRDILSLQPSRRVLFLSSYAEEAAAEAAILAGAAGYLIKDVDCDTLLAAIRDAATGRDVADWYQSRTARERLLDRAAGRQSSAAGVEHLSAQELRIMRLVVEGKTNREIAAALGLSEKTVKNYLSNVFQKLGVGRRAQAAAIFAKRRGP